MKFKEINEVFDKNSKEFKEMKGHIEEKIKLRSENNKLKFKVSELEDEIKSLKKKLKKG